MKKYWGYFLAVFLLGGCIGDEFDTDKLSDDISISPGIALPLGYAELSMRDILSEDTDNVKYYMDEQGNERILLYQNNDSLSYLGVNDFFEVTAASIAVPVPFTGFNASESITGSETLNFSIPNAAISNMTISYSISITGSDFVIPVDIIMFFPTINQVDGGKTIYTQLSGDQSERFFFSNEVVSLSSNQLPVEITIKPAIKMDLYPSDIGTLSMEIGDFEIFRVKGSMSENAVIIDEDIYELDLDVFNEFPDGVTFADPRLHLISNNSTPFRGVISSDFSGETEAGDRMDLATPFIQMSASDPLKTCVIDSTTLDKSNSNIQLFMDQLPEQLYYQGELVLNPGGELSEEVELDDTDRIYVGYSIELPMDLMINSMMDIDTLDLSENDVLSKLEKAKFIVESENGFPMDAEAFIDIYDAETDQVTETIETNLLVGAEVDSEGIVTKTTQHTETIELTDSQIEKLQKADQLFIRIRIVTSDYEKNTSVILLATNQISMQITLKGQLKY